jgi:peroxiredoxin
VGEQAEAVQEFLKGKDVSFKVLLDKDMRVSTQYDIRQHPNKFLINENGKVIGTALGYREWDSDAMKALIKQLINKKESSVRTKI